VLRVIRGLLFGPFGSSLVFLQIFFQLRLQVFLVGEVNRLLLLCDGLGNASVVEQGPGVGVDNARFPAFAEVIGAFSEIQRQFRVALLDGVFCQERLGNLVQELGILELQGFNFFGQFSGFCGVAAFSDGFHVAV